MNNFEKAQILIEELTTENNQLKQKISQMTECNIDMQVDSSLKMKQIERDKNAAMARFTERMRNEARKYREKQNG
jgi:glycine cleavage system regulatory protein